MNDPRLIPNPDLVTRTEPAQIIVPLADLQRSPEGPRDRQVLFGETLNVLNEDHGWCYVQADKDRYCGYVTSDSIGPITEATHHVIAPATHAYKAADFKSRDLCSLSHGSRVTVMDHVGKFAQTAAGFIPMVHLGRIGETATDPAQIASLFLGTPYLWGGNSCFGIDCSGLVQAALLACGYDCPGDSDQQQSLGYEAGDGYTRNDLLFWKGHVALVTDANRLIHANAAAMATVYEPIDTAIARIEAQGDGSVTAHRRLS